MVDVGVISDTHGLLRPEAVEALAGSDLILHAGDVGKREILDRLGRIAPVTAVRGNVDSSSLGLAESEVVEVAGHSIYMLHILQDLDLDPAAAGFDVVLFGHSHRPEIREDGGVLYLNAGSAGPRRFSLPVTVARLELAPGHRRAEIVELTVG